MSARPVPRAAPTALPASTPNLDLGDVPSAPLDSSTGRLEDPASSARPARLAVLEPPAARLAPPDTSLELEPPLAAPVPLGPTTGIERAAAKCALLTHSTTRLELRNARNAARDSSHRRDLPPRRTAR